MSATWMGCWWKFAVRCEPMPNSPLKALQEIPGVGPAIAQDLWDLGIRAVSDLKGRDPEALYQQLCLQQQAALDRCLLYTFRCAVYYASTPQPDPARLKWWTWKDSAQ